MSDLVSEVYSLVKGVEDAFPIPTPVAAVRVGTFNAETGDFDGLRSTIEIFPPDEAHLKPWRQTFPAAADANGVHVILEFEITNAQSTTRLTANGITVEVPPVSRS